MGRTEELRSIAIASAIAIVLFTFAFFSIWLLILPLIQSAAEALVVGLASVICGAGVIYGIVYRAKGQLQQYLLSMDFPASKDEVLSKVQNSDVPQEVADRIRNARTDTFNSLDEVLQQAQGRSTQGDHEGSESEERTQASQVQGIDALPSAQRALITRLYTSANALAQADTDKPQQVAASAANMLASYYTAALLESRRSFNSALIGASVGVLFFLAAVGFALKMQSTELAIVSALAGTIIELISGLAFYLYGKTAQQLSEYRRSLEQTQRFLLAYSIAGTLGSEKEKTRAELVNMIAQAGSPSPRNGESKTPAKDQESRP